MIVSPTNRVPPLSKLVTYAESEPVQHDTWRETVSGYSWSHEFDRTSRPHLLCTLSDIQDADSSVSTWQYVCISDINRIIADHERKQFKLKALRNRQDLFQEEVSLSHSRVQNLFLNQNNYMLAFRVMFRLKKLID